MTEPSDPAATSDTDADPDDSPTTPVALTKTGADSAAASTAATSDDGGSRGRLDIALGVVRKIAEHAADVTEGTTTRRRRLAGMSLGSAGSSARVSGYGDQVDVRLELPLTYPSPIVPTVAAVRGNVRDRVQSLTGYRVRTLDVAVSALTDPTSRME